MGKHRLMIVDDSRVVYASMSKMLDGEDVEIVGFFRSGEEALENYGELMPDLVTLDIVMPGMDGLETCEKLLEKWPDAQILMVSSLAYDDTIERAKELGAKGFLFKPFTKESLTEGIMDAFKAIDEAEA